MKNARFYILILLLGLPLSALHSQQLPNFTQYMFNDFVLNPAIAGTRPYYEIRSNSRFQWAGVIDAPQTMSLSIYGPHSSKDMGFGGYLFNDITGPTSRTGLYGSYAYNVGINDNIRLSMGLSAGILQNKVDGTKITLFDPNDQALQESVYSSYSPDASIGLYAYGENWFAGFSAFQLFANSLKYYDVKSGLNKLKTHYYLMAGYRFEINSDFMVEGSSLVKKVTPVPFQVELNVRGMYQKKFWLGVSYRSSDAMSVLLGYIHMEKYYFGYAYDIGLSDFRKYNSGSHEIMVGVRFNKIKNP